MHAIHVAKFDKQICVWVNLNVVYHITPLDIEL